MGLFRFGVIAAALAVMLSACAPSVPREDVPPGWSLNVHQSGEWWTQPLIPRSVVLQRCPLPNGWWSEPNLLITAALPPGTMVNYLSIGDEYHCEIGWSQPAANEPITTGDLSSEADLRRICSSSGLPMDDTWRFLGEVPNKRGGAVGADWPAMESVTAAWVDDFGTVVGCAVRQSEAGPGYSIVLAVGGDVAPGQPACPVRPSNLARTNAGTVSSYSLEGAGAVRGPDGKVLTRAATVELGLAGDTVTTTHAVTDGVAIVNATVVPDKAIPFEWDALPAIEGRVLDAEGELLATCGNG